MRLFNRRIELSVGETKIPGLDIGFTIEKDDSPEPNTAQIDIYNLSEQNRSTLSKYDGVPVILRAGYEEHVGVIFKGCLNQIQHIKEPVSWKTTLRCGDGLKEIQNARIKKSYIKGTPLKTIVQDLAKSLGQTSNAILSNISELTQKTQRSISLDGNSMGELNRVLSFVGCCASFQDNELQVISRGGANQKKIIVLSPNTGLIGTPMVGPKNQVELNTLILPALIPGSQAKVKSQTWEGIFTIKKASLNGSNFADEWVSELVGQSDDHTS